MHDEQQLRRDAQDLLRRFGPSSAEELARHLVGHGHYRPPAELRHLLLSEVTGDTGEDAVFAAYPLADGRLVDLDDLVEGVVLTHRVSDAERDIGEVDGEPDLSLLHVLRDERGEVALAGGGVLEVSLDAVTGPAGWLPDAPGIAVTVRGRRVEVAPVDELPEPDEVVVERLAATSEALVGLIGRVDPVELVYEARARHPQLLSAPAAPLSEHLAAAGLRLHDGFVRRVGDPGDDDPFDDDPYGDDDPYSDDLVAHLRSDHGFDDATIIAVMEVTNAVLAVSNDVMRLVSEALEDLVAAVDDGDAPVDDDREERDIIAEAMTDIAPDDDVLAALATALAGPDVVEALLHDVVGDDHVAAAVLLGLVDRMVGRLDRRPRAHRHWLRASLLEFVAEDHADAESELRRALDLDPHLGGAVFDLARYRSDRGEAGAALGLLRQLELHGADHHWVELLERYAAPGPASAGRNDPCPCGSGRKHKVCCAVRNGWSLADRVEWIHDKLARFATSAPNADRLEGVRTAGGAATFRDLWGDLALTNLLMFDAGTVQAFADARGSLLPTDELEFVRGWAEVTAGAYEVVDVDGDEVALLDQATGDRVTFVDRTFSGEVATGELLLAWVAPGPDGPVPVQGAIPVPPRAWPSLLALLDDDPTAEDVAYWYRSLTAPPRLANTEGEPLVMTTLTYELADPAVAGARLAERLEPLDAGDDADAVGAVDDEAAVAETRFGEYAPTSIGDRTLRGTVTIAGDRLEIETNSSVRADRLRHLVEELLPDAVLVDGTRTPIAELMGADHDDEDDADAEPDEATEAAMAEAMEAYMADYEERWLDMELPALGGRTPRQAVDDPTRRGELDRLLRDMPPAGTSLGAGRVMDPDRLRRLLGL